MSSLSGTQSVVSGAWARLQQQQAQRAADQAETRARSLQAMAQDARSGAERAQENARALEVQSEQAQQSAESARMGLATSRVMEKMQSEFGGLRQQLASVLGSSKPEVATVTSPVTTPVVVPPTAVSGSQRLGSIVDVSV